MLKPSPNVMPNNFEPHVGHEFQFRTKPAPGFDGIVNCVVLEVEPPRPAGWSIHGRAAALTQS